MELELRNNKSDILTNDRKTYYETDALDRLKLWYSFWWYVYYVIVLVVLLSMLFVKSMYTWKVKLVIFILLVFYPYYINFITEKIKGLYKNITDSIPKNVYNNL